MAARSVQHRTFTLTANKAMRAILHVAKHLWQKAFPLSRFCCFRRLGEIPQQVFRRKKSLKQRKETMKMRLLGALLGLAIGFAVPAAMAQEAMKVVTADELVWKEHPVFKDAQIVILVGDPTKAETIVQRVKFPPHFKVPPHTHPYSEVVT